MNIACVGESREIGRRRPREPYCALGAPKRRERMRATGSRAHDQRLSVLQPSVLYGLEEYTTIRIVAARARSIPYPTRRRVNRRTDERTRNSHGFYGSARKDIPEAFSVEPGAPPFTPPVCPSRPLRGHARFRNPEAEDRGLRARFLLEDNETERASEGGNERERG